MPPTQRNTRTGSRTSTIGASLASTTGQGTNANQQPQQNAVLNNVLQQLANGIPGLYGGAPLPPPPPPFII